MLRPANAGLSGAIAWLDSLTKANARSRDLGRELTQVLNMTLSSFTLLVCYRQGKLILQQFR